MAELQDEAVEDLKRSRKVVGELLPIVTDQHGRVLNGRHRDKAGWKSKVVMSVTDDLDFYIKRLHFLVQRKSTPNELIETFSNIATLLEGKGMPKNKIAGYIVREISPFGQSYTYALIPDAYKVTGYGREDSSQNNVGKLTTGPLRYEFTQKTENEDIAAPFDTVYPCPRCGCPAPHVR